MHGPNEYLFLLGQGHLPTKADRIARTHKACLVNYTEPGTRIKRHWFAGPNRGNPFNRSLRDAVLADLQAAGIEP